jgi:membrane associated rhomboid family serine protease
MTEDVRQNVGTTCYRHPDRETGLSCSNCGRPICAECMTATPVGQRCPECVGHQQVRRPRTMSRTTPYVTYVLIGINVAMFLWVVSRGGGDVMGLTNRDLFDAGGLEKSAVADGEWWRLVSAMFLHASILHIAFNMWGLWILGPILENRYGPLRFIGLYVVSGLCGSAGALLMTDPGQVTVGASGAIFGLMAALFVVERRHNLPIASGIGVVLVLNLVITFSIPGISIGGHIGGLVGGALCGLLYETTARRGGGPLAVAGTAGLLLAALAATIVAVG